LDKVRVGLIGAGGISRAHIPGYLACRDRAEVVAIADPVEEAARAPLSAVSAAPESQLVTPGSGQVLTTEVDVPGAGWP